MDNGSGADDGGNPRPTPPPPPPAPVARSSSNREPTGSSGTGGGLGGLAAAMASKAGTLKPTETMVRNRNGEVFVERLGDDGSYETTDRGVVQTVDLSQREPFAFDAATGAWMRMTRDQVDAQVPISVNQLDRTVMVSYNVWFVDTAWEERCDALVDILGEILPDVFCFQEVTERFLKRFLLADWVRDGYLLSDGIGTSVFPYGCLIGTRLPVDYFQFEMMPSNMGRRFLKCHIRTDGTDLAATAQEEAASSQQPAPEHELVIGTAHLESRDNREYRIAQLEQIIPIMDEAKHAFFMGDFNFGDGEPENAILDASSLTDAWVELDPGGETFTRPHIDEEGNMFDMHRIDHVMYRSPSLVPTDFQVLGNHPHPTYGVHPSDHFGLCFVFSPIPSADV